MDWSYLLQFHKNPPISGLPRSPEIENAYHRYRERYDTTQYIKSVYLDNKNFVCYALNLFPYSVKQGIYHCVAWFKNHNLDPDNFIESELRILGIKDYIIFTNNVENRSVPSLHHTHIFLRSIDDYIKLLTISR